jgi:hypothetical protein
LNFGIAGFREVFQKKQIFRPLKYRQFSVHIIFKIGGFLFSGVSCFNDQDNFIAQPDIGNR